MKTEYVQTLDDWLDEVIYSIQESIIRNNNVINIFCGSTVSFFETNGTAYLKLKKGTVVNSKLEKLHQHHLKYALVEQLHKLGYIFSTVDYSGFVKLKFIWPEKIKP